jgi:hypothetical protein
MITKATTANRIADYVTALNEMDLAARDHAKEEFRCRLAAKLDQREGRLGNLAPRVHAPASQSDVTGNIDILNNGLNQRAHRSWWKRLLRFGGRA